MFRESFRIPRVTRNCQSLSRNEEIRNGRTKNRLARENKRGKGEKERVQWTRDYRACRRKKRESGGGELCSSGLNPLA